LVTQNALFALPIPQLVGQLPYLPMTFPCPYSTQLGCGQRLQLRERISFTGEFICCLPHTTTAALCRAGSVSTRTRNKTAADFENNHSLRFCACLLSTALRTNVDKSRCRRSGFARSFDFYTLWSPRYLVHKDRRHRATCRLSVVWNISLTK